MAFPDDYKRVKMAGGTATDVDVHLGIPGQIIIDKTNWNIRLLDGVSPGGFKVVMEKDLVTNLQDPAFEGESLYIALGTDSGVGLPDSRARLWKASKLKAFFQKFLTITPNGGNTDFTVELLDSAMRANLRTLVPQITNLDLGTTTGFWRFQPSSALNLPADYPTTTAAHGFLLVMSQSTNELLQLAYVRDGTNRVWARQRVAGAFSAWGLASGITQSDLNGYLKINGTDQMGGILRLFTSTVGAASMRLLSGLDPNAPVDGDIWRRDATGGLMWRKGGATLSLLDTGNGPTFIDDRITAQASSKMFGIGQTWTDVTGTRTPGVTYQNTTAKPIAIALNAYQGGGGALSFETGPTAGSLTQIGAGFYDATSGGAGSVFVSQGPFPVPPGHFYKYTGVTPSFWKEMR